MSKKSNERSRWYLGALFTFLATGKDTNGQYSLTESFMRKGLEPPRHKHTKEDEMVYMLEGEVKFVVGEEEFMLTPGMYINLPKNIPHSFKILTEESRFLVQTVPAGLEEMFFAMSVPAEKLELPARPSGPPPAEVLQKLAALQKQHGIEILQNVHSV